MAPPDSSVVENVRVRAANSYRRKLLHSGSDDCPGCGEAGKTLTVCQGRVVGERDSRRETVAVMQATIINIPGGG